VKINPAFAQIHDHRLPHLAVEDTVPVPGDDDPQPASTDAKPERQDPYRADDGSMSWGGSGYTQTAPERNAETIPQSALQSAGIDPSMVPMPANPTPSTLGEPLRPGRSGGASGNLNMGDIANYKIG
jgi:hypothetical protein